MTINAQFWVGFISQSLGREYNVALLLAVILAEERGVIYV